MAEPSVIHDTFVIEQSYPAPPARVFAAFADPALKRRWFAEGHQHDVEAFEMDFRVGGLERAAYRFNAGGPFEGVGLVHEGVYLEIVPDARIVSAGAMAMGGHRISASLVTFELLAEGAGTTLVFTHQGAFFEGADGPAMRQDGWKVLLDQLARVLA
ncbi:SRPBCC family protein [soil metagenome]